MLSWKLSTLVSTNPLQFFDEPLKMFTTSFNGSPHGIHAVRLQRLEPMQADHHFSSFWTEHDPTEKWTWRYPFSSSMIMGQRIYQFVSKRDFSNGNHIQTHDDRFRQSEQLKASPRQQFRGCYYSIIIPNTLSHIPHHQQYHHHLLLFHAHCHLSSYTITITMNTA